MICLDTNYLIRGLVSESDEAAALIAWTQAGEILVTPSVAWYEFLCGPVTQEQVNIVRAFLREVVPFDAEQAVEAARLFNAAVRSRRTRVDAMIASAAIVLGASLATDNRADFEVFVEYGLELADD
jgi:predicted nucleic acid-binding protein